MGKEILERYYLFYNDDEKLPLFEMQIMEGSTRDGAIFGRLLEIDHITMSALDPELRFDYSFVADLYIKSDTCMHWNFCGEDFEFDDHELCNGFKPDNISAYYHICGTGELIKKILGMNFVIKVAEDYLLNFKKHEDTFDGKSIDDLNLLKDCTVRCYKRDFLFTY